MTRTVKREQVNNTSSRPARTERVVADNEDLRALKQEKASRVESTQQGATDRRVLRSRYLAVKNLINDERDDISKVDSDKFCSIISEVENLHQLVQKPREQVADAEALLDIANTLMTSFKTQSNDGVTPSDFVACLLKEYGQSFGGRNTDENVQNSIRWKDVGFSVSHIFGKSLGCCTMLGPMNTELKQRKVVVQRKRTRPTENARPEELDDTGEEQTDTDKNMATMFGILRKNKRVKLESLMLNRTSFAQTVENLFALSFLVKDGRAEIVIDEEGSHLVSPRNAPASNLVMSGDVTYGHFVFRFDFKDWKLMKDMVPEGEELMPGRERSNNLAYSQSGPQAPYIRTPIKKLSRNRGRIIQEDAVVEDSPVIDEAAAEKATAIRKCKRKLNEEL